MTPAPQRNPAPRAQSGSANRRPRRKKRTNRVAFFVILLIILGLAVVGGCSLFSKPAPLSPAAGTTAADAPATATEPPRQPAAPLPVIQAPEALSSVVVEGKIASLFDPLEGVSAADETGKTYPVTVEGSFDLSKAGDYALTYVAVADDGRRAVKEVTLSVRSPFDEKGNLIDGTYKTFRGFEIVVKDGLATVNGLLIVNKSYTVPEGFSSTGDGSRSLRPETESAWFEMKKGAPADINANLKIKSGVRNISDQTSIFNNYVKTDGLEEAMTYSAKPRHSEHHTGLAMDITASGRDTARLPANAPVMDWLNENAWQYGFIQRYPENKTDETGYIYEQWHYRYVGKELAEVLYNNGDWITMEAYFGFDSVYRD